jgi:hypothetical protein
VKFAFISPMPFGRLLALPYETNIAIKNDLTALADQD